MNKKIQKIDLEKLKNNTEGLFFLPLGGANEIGMNFNLYFYRGHWLIIDCGVGFADDTIYPGVRLLLPKIDFILKNNIKISGMVITHIHEDHVGGVAYLWDKIKCPIWATPLASSFIVQKFAEVTYKERPKLNVIADSYPFEIDSFKLEMVGLTHSVPEMKAVILHTHLGPIVHTGDWKFDDDPVVGEASDYRRLKELGKQGVYAAICDSTNIFSEGWSGSEGVLEDNIYKIIKNHDKRVLITTFASNIARLQTVSNLAKRTGRKLIVAGRSLMRMIDVAHKNGYLFDSVDFLDQREGMTCPREKALIICTGCQGEENAALTKMANGEHMHISLTQGDLVLFSSKIIPGNEKAIHHVVNQLAKMDVDIVTEKMAKIHVSGHPYRDELKKMYSLLKPRYVIPVHGEPAHIREHCKFALEECGVNDVVRVKNGDCIMMDLDEACKIGEVDNGYIAIDGKIQREGNSRVFNERKQMAEHGQLTCLIILNAQENFVFAPEIYTEGFLNADQDKHLLKEIINKTHHNINTCLSKYNVKKERQQIIDTLTKMTLKLCQELTDKRPFVNIILKKI